ncbi:MAG: hypothetical protein U9Q88_02500 [Bacillota bacterium]|jgi:hypothetical protein|uniref:hypothetical protein n=1 Tax=Bacillus sp. RO2 TaxID=2723913 RepID=UPI00145FCC9C|nr:hypothetical protein [Bacillus sp. RO2]MEA3318870.1 hypothetical protein [Bacillota bacterium]NMH72682.1 hypothetical protein [Bacillus sp. RO2]
MKQVATPWKKKKEENQRAVLRMEIDYELAVLFEAIQESDKEKMKKTKSKLEQLRKEMLSLGV